MLTGLNHLTLSVSNLARSVNFYQTLLGIPLVCSWVKGAYFSLGSFWLCLIEETAATGLPPVIPAANYTHYAFSIVKDEFQQFVHKLNRSNIACWQSNSSEGDSYYFLDPDGHKLEVHVGDLSSRLTAYEKKPPVGYKRSPLNHFSSQHLPAMPIKLSPYQKRWSSEFEQIKQTLQASTGQKKIEHIGSTSVEHLMAKDILDIQLGVDSFDDFPLLQEKLEYLSFQHLPEITKDHIPLGFPEEDYSQWEKRFFRSSPPLRPMNLHVRILGHHNWNYALAFRDFLRTHPTIAQMYGQAKERLAENLTDNASMYPYVKDPICDLIFAMVPSPSNPLTKLSTT